MRKIIFCIVINCLCLSYSAQAQWCDFEQAPDAKEWVENNRDKIAEMNRSEYQKLDEGYKFATSLALSPKQKHDFFRQKIEQVRDNFEWNKEEKEHLDRMYQFFIDNPDMYSEIERDDKKDAEMQEFTRKWVTDAMENLNWTCELVQGITFHIEDLLDKEGNVVRGQGIRRGADTKMKIDEIEKNDSKE